MSDKARIILTICQPHDSGFIIETNKPISLQGQMLTFRNCVGLEKFIKEANLLPTGQSLVEKILTEPLVRCVTTMDDRIDVGISHIADFIEVQEIAGWVVSVVRELLFPDATRWNTIHEDMSHITTFEAE